MNPKIICPAVDSLVVNTSPVFISSITKILNKEKVRIKSYTVLDFITRNKENYLKFFNALLAIDYQDDLGKTSLHYAVQYNCKDTIEHILNYKHDILEKDILQHGSFKKPEYENSNLVQFVNKEDNQDKTALDYAEDSKLDMMLSFKLLLKGANINGLTKEYLEKLINYMLYTDSSHNFNNHDYIFDGSILGAYANQDNKFRAIQEKLLLQYPSTVSNLSENYQYPRLLSYFFVHGRVEVIKALLNDIPDQEKKRRLLNADDNGYTPLDRVNDSDQLSDDDRLKITRYLLENGGTEAKHDVGYSSYNTDSSNSYITKILQAAAQHGHIETFKYFINQETVSYYHLHLYQALQNKQQEIVIPFPYYNKLYNF